MIKTENKYTLKSSKLAIKDLDTGSNTVSMYLNAFDVIDSDKDIIRQGAFKKSIQERGPLSQSNRKIAFLRYHNWEMPIGKFLELREDKTGLFAVAQLGNSTIAKDAMEDYKDGIIREHSIGFQYIKDKVEFIEAKNDSEEDYFNIKEVILWEGSAVTFGSNENTNVIDVSKSIKTEKDKNKKISELSNELDLCIKSLVNGKGTDERLYQLEMKVKYLNSQIFTLATFNPFDKQLEAVKSNQKEFNWNKVITNINF